VRLVTFVGAEGTPQVGVLVESAEGDRVFALPTTMAELIADGPALDAARQDAELADIRALPLISDVVLLAPVRPRVILCLGYNYRGHRPPGADAAEPDPEFPNVFVKTPNTIIGPRDDVVLPLASAHTDYEGEIAIVIGRRAQAVPLASASEHIAGYTLFNDVSSRDWQDRSSQWELGKCFDGFGPLGPWIVTADAVPDPHDLRVEVVRDGRVTVSQSTSTLVFRMDYLVHYLSQVMTLEPGDLISTGSPQKLPEALAGHRPLADGDSVTVRVAGLGELTTRFVNSPSGTACP
jgi:2-keto-4-pentenoate hydratase/2-oxohepta-3-ene-1,7-dioic acid hydratase in catechol pathway